MLINQTVKKFIEKTAEATSVPGGGSVAALSGALATSLFLMAAKITNRKELKISEKIIKQLEKNKKRLTELIDEDANAYALVETTLSMPQKTEEEKTARKNKLTDALKIAVEIPLETSRLTKNTLTIILDKKAVILPSMISDVKTAEELCKAAIDGAVATASINIPTLNYETPIKQLN